MCWFYILKNEVTNKYYTGSTINLKKRLKQHLRGNTRTTRVLKTYKLIYWEKFDKIDIARRREKQIKSYKSKKDSFLRQFSVYNMLIIVSDILEFLTFAYKG